MRTMDVVLVLWQRVVKGFRRITRRKAFWISVGSLAVITYVVLLTNSRRHRNDYAYNEEAHGIWNDKLLADDISVMQNRTNHLLKLPLKQAPLKSHWVGDVPLPKQHLDNLKWNYLLEEKELPYTGHKEWMHTLKSSHPLYPNALAVFANPRPYHEHGDIGISREGVPLWRTHDVLPPPFDSLTPEAQKLVMKERGFYEDYSNALPVDRRVIDTREDICKAEKYDIPDLPDASIVITFVNEPLSTLLRTLHSVLNNTPAPLLREIILVDDHSNFVDNVPGGPLYEYIKYLPKVKLMRLPERRGIVQARLAGARAAKGTALVILDSHIEVNPGWLEPQLQRIAESPSSVVFPQILGLLPTTFERKTTSGIGCYVNWRWSIVEQSSLTGKVKSTAPVPSASMAGGLFAVNRDYFWEIGGYDEGFIAWGAENVEFAFRIWMCGGRVECVPCSRTYHVYRKGSTGYQNPHGALWINRMRTARVWMDEYFQLAKRLIDVSANRPPGITADTPSGFGSLKTMLRLKKSLECKSFKWFLDNVDPQHDIQKLDDVLVLGKLGNGKFCLDLSGHRSPGEIVKTYQCHVAKHPSGNQAFLISVGDNRIRLMTNDKRCIAKAKNSDGFVIAQCMEEGAQNWEAVVLRRNDTAVTLNLQWKKTGECLAISEAGLELKNCKEAELTGDAFIPDPAFALPEIDSSKLRGNP